MKQQKPFNLRSYTDSDTDAVVQTINVATTQTIGSPRAVVDTVGNVRLMRYVPATSKKVVAINMQNEVVGYSYLSNLEQNIVYEVGGAVHPDYWGYGIGSMLLNWAEENAHSQSIYAPEDVKTILQANIYKVEHSAIELFTQRNYVKMREWMHLAIDLDHPPHLSTLTDNLQIRKMDIEKDWEIVGPAMDDAFADHWGAIPFLQTETSAPNEPEPILDLPEDESYSNAPGFCFIVLDENKVVGGVLCNRKVVGRNDTGRVGSLFVRPEYRRRGIGRALMLKSFQNFWQHGWRSSGDLPARPR